MDRKTLLDKVARDERRGNQEWNLRVFGAGLAHGHDLRGQRDDSGAELFISLYTCERQPCIWVSEVYDDPQHLCAGPTSGISQVAFTADEFRAWAADAPAALAWLDEELGRSVPAAVRQAVDPETFHAGRSAGIEDQPH